MATIIRTLVNGYRYINEDATDPRSREWFLIGSPWLGIAILTVYIYFVQYLGPHIMKDRKPFNLKRTIQLYNVVQIILNAFLLYKALVLGWLWNYKIFCEPVDFSNTPHAIEIARTVWLFFIVKIIDLMDTVFFVLRKKQSQISFLHLYHHTGMVLGTWAATKYVPGGHITSLGLINSFVHMVMYTYYLATSFNYGNLWWKKHITQLQLVQFLLLLIHHSSLIFKKDCEFPTWPAIFLIPQNLFMITMFSDFYYKEYFKKNKREKSVQNGDLNGTAKMK